MFKSYRSYFCIGYLVHILILLDLALSTTAYKNPSSDFRTHSIVRPKLQHGRTKREITSTKHSTGSHHPEVTLTVSIDGEEHELELRLNEELVPRGHTLSYQQGGETRANALGKEELDICQYSGLVRGKPGSWAAVSTCTGVRGVIYDGEHMRYIEPKKDKVINADHFLYSHEHLAKEHRCGSEDAASRNSSSSSRFKRNSFDDTLVRPPYNVNSRSRYVELVLVADNHEFRASGGDLYIVHQHMKDLANIINSVYAPLNIFIALVGVEVWSEYNKIQLAEDSGKTLDNFVRYRETELSRRIPNDNAHLLTRQEFTGGVVGKALVGVMCSHKRSAGIATDHSEVIGLVAMTIAHEMGHNFGMNHDDETDCSCPGPKCIMSSVSAAWITPVHWSSCSLTALALSFEKGLDYCLRNKPARLLGPPTCGNGFLEEGEQCDCGTLPGELAPRDKDRSSCTKCCTPDCTLRGNATCGHGECCDLTTCNYKAVATECRSAERECDLPEFCSGKSQFCPQDFHKMDTTPCRNDQGYCMRGWCRSHEDQCRLLWGSTGVNADDKCYSMTNGKGNIYGNCGYDTNGQPRPCAPQDVACGLLHCHHYNDRLQYGIESATTMKSFLQFSDHLIAPCHAAVTGLGAGPNDDPGLVPDGAKCGTDKMCMDHKCQSVARVRAAMARQGFICPSNCSGHGVCNSNGNCHCDPGFAPPLCDSTGPGGSIDSLPATDIRGSKIFMVVMYVVFLGIIPAIVLVLVLIYCFCPNAPPSWMKLRGWHAQNLSGATNLNGCCSKFKLPNFSRFGKLLRKSSKKVIRDCKSELTPGKLVVDSAPTNTKTITLTTKSVVDVDDNQVYANVSNFIRPNCNIEATNATTEHITNMQNHNSVGLNRKINKEDIVIVENYNNHVGVHKNAAYNIDANIKPKPDITINKLKIPRSAENSVLNSPNVKDLNNPNIEVVKNNYKPQTKGHTSINRPLLRPAPNIPSVNSKPSVNNKPSVSLKPNDKPVVSLKPKPNTMLSDESKPKTKLINDQVSTTNELVNQRAKLRKVTNRDVTK